MKQQLVCCVFSSRHKFCLCINDHKIASSSPFWIGTNVRELDKAIMNGFNFIKCRQIYFGCNNNIMYEELNSI